MRKIICDFCSKEIKNKSACLQLTPGVNAKGDDTPSVNRQKNYDVCPECAHKLDYRGGDTHTVKTEGVIEKIDRLLHKETSPSPVEYTCDCHH